MKLAQLHSFQFPALRPCDDTEGIARTSVDSLTTRVYREPTSPVRWDALCLFGTLGGCGNMAGNSILMILFGSVIAVTTALTFMEVRRMRKSDVIHPED
jgi:hypothetical protein